MATTEDPCEVDPSAPTHPSGTGTGGLGDDPSACIDADLLGLTVQNPASGVCVVLVNGELDTLTVPLLEACLGEQLATVPAHLIVDLQAVRFLGSSALNCLLNARERAELAGVQLHLAGLVTRLVRRPLEVTGLLERFDTYPTLSDVLAAVIG